MECRFFPMLIACAAGAAAQTPLPMRYLGEVGHLGGLDPRSSANLLVAKAFPESNGDLLIQGHDKAGNRWRVWLEPAAGVGGTDVWSADFDHDGQRDLMFSAMYPQNGHCVDGTIVYTLMFDSQGRPVPTVFRTHTFGGFGHPPLGVVQVKGRAGARLVTSSCEYSNQLVTRVFEDRQTSGIYEAKDARWIPLRDASEGPYRAVIARHQPTTPGYMRWLEPEPAQWTDFLAGYGQQPNMQLVSLRTKAEGCGGLRLSMVDGRLDRTADDVCDRLNQDRIVFSDGVGRDGWPPVMIDSAQGRDIYLSRNFEALLGLMSKGYRFKALGQNIGSPDLLWADTRSASEPGAISSRLRTSDVKRFPLTVEEKSAADNKNGIAKCYRLLLKESGAEKSAAWGNCPVSDRRIFRTAEYGERDPAALELPVGLKGQLDSAVDFRDWWLAEWKSNDRRFLVLHSREGKALTGPMEMPSDLYLIDSEISRGVSFVRLENGVPKELILQLAWVEWFKALQ